MYIPLIYFIEILAIFVSIIFLILFKLLRKIDSLNRNQENQSEEYWKNQRELKNRLLALELKTELKTKEEVEYER